MKITEVSGEYGLVVNDGNYGSERVTIQLTAVIGDSEDPEDAMRLLIDTARHGVRFELEKSRTAEVRRRVTHVEGDPEDSPF
jgi:hypothetical protein